MTKFYEIKQKIIQVFVGEEQTDDIYLFADTVVFVYQHQPGVVGNPGFFLLFQCPAGLENVLPG